MTFPVRRGTLHRGLSVRSSFARGLFARGAFSACALILASALSGCLKAPEPEPLLILPAVPKAPVFDPADYITHGAPLPGTYRVTGITSGEILTIQGVLPSQNGAVQTKQYGVPETVHLAGIVAPAPGQPGWQSAVGKANSWLAGKEDLLVEVDAKYPLDLENRRMVQIYFNPTKTNATSRSALSAPSGVQWNLNRMLVHTGYAVVDLYGATSIDVHKWLNDEEFAKTYIDQKSGKLKPLGLWGMGIVMPQRDRSILPVPNSAGGVFKGKSGDIAVGSTTSRSTTGGNTTVVTQKRTSSTRTSGAATAGAPTASGATSRVTTTVTVPTRNAATQSAPLVSTTTTSSTRRVETSPSTSR